MFRTKIIKTELVAEQTLAIWVEKPAGYEFKAGMFASVEIAGRPTLPIHYFSIASSPHEDSLVFATRLTGSEFKNELAKLKAGDELSLSAPMGTMGLTNTGNRVVFVIGGIGITVARSIIIDELFRESKTNILLFYANRNEQVATFLDELQRLQNDKFKIIPVMSAQENWNGEKGYIDEEKLKRLAGLVEENDYYVVGPPQMVAGIKKVLQNLKISEERIKTESFSGY